MQPKGLLLILLKAKKTFQEDFLFQPDLFLLQVGWLKGYQFLTEGIRKRSLFGQKRYIGG